VGRVEELGRGRLLVDLGFHDTEGLVASYLLPGPEGWSVVETGPTTSRASLLDGLRTAGVAPEEVTQVFVTHIHLDHAGGLGAIAEALPRARLYAHRDGIPHLIDPSRLIASARRAWGAAADPLWGPILPVPVERLKALSGGERFPLREGTLEVLATPGHARHHLSFLDTGVHALMTGDSAGVRLRPSEPARPAVPPPDLDLEALFASLERMRATEPRVLWYAHFGACPAGPGVFEEYRASVERWRDVALATAREQPTVPAVAAALRDLELGTRATVGEDRDPGALVSSYEMAAQGLLRYFQGHDLLPKEGP
jgi:glyoxylase-like metal-dependent hydrolase (beta-lactamase superfamily II)